MNNLFHIRYCSLFVLAIVWAFGLPAQQYNYVRYTMQDGLPTNYVYGVVEDEEGTIWAYTENGLAKFDGYEFHPLNSKHGLPSNDVIHAVTGQDGKIWLSLYNGPMAYLYDDSIHIVNDGFGRFNRFIEDEIPLYNQGYRAFAFADSLLELNWKKLTQDELRYFGEEWRAGLQLPNSDPAVDSLVSKSSFIAYFTERNDTTTFWLSATGPFLKLPISRSRFLYFDVPDRQLSWKNEQGGFTSINTPECSTLGSVWPVPGDSTRFIIHAYTGTSLPYLFAMLDIASGTIRYFHPSDFGLLNNLQSIISLQESDFWLQSSNSAIRLSYSCEVLEELRWGEEQDWTMLRTYTDRQGNIWQGTRSGGLLMVPSRNRRCRQIVVKEQAPLHFEKLFLAKSGKVIGVTADGFAYEVNPTEMTTQRLPGFEKQRLRCVDTNGPEIVLLANGDVQQLEFLDGRWRSKPILGDVDIRVRPSAFAPYAYDNPFVTADLTANSITKIPGGSQIYLVNTVGGLGVIAEDTASKKWTYGPLSLQSKLVHYDQWQNQIWTIVEDKVYQIQGDNLVPLPALDNKLQNITVLQSAPGKLWLGTEKEGLFCYNFAAEELLFVAPADQIRAIKEDGERGVIAAANDGVLVVSGASPQDYFWYTTKDGLPNAEIEDVLALGDTAVCVATANGIYLLDRQFPAVDSLPPSALRIESVIVDDRPVEGEQLQHLSHRSEQLSFQFLLRAYASEQNITYRSKLEPLEDDWVESVDRLRRYPGLAPGHYQFHLQAIDRYGQVLEHPPLDIYIRPAFWQTLWFKALLLVTLVGVLIYLGLWRIRRVEQKLNAEKELHRRMAQLELDALKSQMNPHFVFNALGSIQYYIQTHETELANDYLTRFASLMRKYLDSSRDTFISIEEEVLLLQDYVELEEMRFEQLFRVEIDTSAVADTKEHYIPAMIIQPFVENAINHGLGERRDGKGELRVHFAELETGTIQCTITDNGIGRTKAQDRKRSGHRSRGMKIVAEKIETLAISQLVDIDLRITDADSEQLDFPGTQVIITFKTVADEEA